jgi:hypothetical protein
MVRRAILVTTLLLACAACGYGDDVTGALSPPPTVSPTGPTGGATGATGGVSGATGESGATGATGRPAITVRTPTGGDEVVSPVTISGTADVFEATVNVQILDANGQILAAGFATATCGTGCRGRYSTSVSFFTQERQAGTVEVYEVSAKDGAPINVVSIPVTLVPGP